MTLEISIIAEAELSTAANIIQTVYNNFGELAAQEFSRSFRNEQHPTHVFLAKKNGQPIGIAACIETYFAFDIYGICWVAVLKEHRRQGICKSLINYIENYISTSLLKGKKGTVILSANITDYYAQLGYEKNSQPMHDGSFIMSKTLNASD